MTQQEYNILSAEILDASIEVHRTMGPGLLKSVVTMLPVFEAQIISHLKLTNKHLGFLINFNVPLLKQGFKRFVNNY